MTSKWQGVRLGLIKGRIRNVDKPQAPNPKAMAFRDALEQASIEELSWALNLLISHPTTKNSSGRTYREYRMKAIADRMTEILHKLATAGDAAG
jgi:hypothetical protein